MIEAHAFFGRDGKPATTADVGRWSFYTASVLASSNCVREVRARLRLKNFDRDSVLSAGNRRAMADGCGSKGMAVTAVRSGVSAKDG